jgi:hypothetical protein
MDLTGNWVDDAGFNYDHMRVAELTEGMRVLMPSGQVLVVAEIKEPDEDGVYRVTCTVPTTVA